MPYSHNQLSGQLTLMLTGEDQQPVFSQGGLVTPELFVILATLSLLDSSKQYVVYDPEESTGTISPSEELITQLLNQEIGEVCSWQGDLPESVGYGDVRLLNTAVGLGLCVTVGGSPISSAVSFWVVPVA